MNPAYFTQLQSRLSLRVTLHTVFHAPPPGFVTHELYAESSLRVTLLKLITLYYADSSLRVALRRNKLKLITLRRLESPAYVTPARPDEQT